MMEKDIQKGLQELYNFDYDNYGLDVEEQDDDLSWIDDLFERYEKVAV